MITGQVAPFPGPPGSDTARQLSGQTLGKDDFLRLLLTQLQHQDPLNPMDNTQFIAQTAQFTSLEQLQNINTALGKLTAASTASGVSQAAALLGKTVKTAGSGPVSLPYSLAGASAPVHVEVLDQDGNVLRSMDIGSKPAGAYTAQWDGRDSAGHPMASGRYYYRVSAVGGTGGSDGVASAAEGPLTGFEVRGGALRYRLGTALIRPEDIVDVRQ